FFTTTPTPRLSPLSLHDALPIYAGAVLGGQIEREVLSRLHCDLQAPLRLSRDRVGQLVLAPGDSLELVAALPVAPQHVPTRLGRDRKSTRLNSSHEWTSYAVFCF